MIQLFSGTDTTASYFACTKEAARLAGKQGEVFSFDADELSEEEIGEILQNTTLFGNKRIVVLKRGLSSHAEAIDGACKLSDEDHVLLWEDGEVDKKKHKALIKSIEKNGKIQNFNKQVFKKDEKAERNIIYAFSDAWVEGRREQTIKMFYNLLLQNIPSMEVFWALHWQIRSMLRVSVLTRQCNEKEIIAKTKLHPYVVGKNLRALQRRNHQSLHKALLQLQEIDVKTKTASVQMEDALLQFLLTT